MESSTSAVTESSSGTADNSTGSESPPTSSTSTPQVSSGSSEAPQSSSSASPQPSDSSDSIGSSESPSSSSSLFCGPDITDWLVTVMNAARTSRVTATLQALNGVPPPDSFFPYAPEPPVPHIMAWELWTAMVRPYGPWDLGEYLTLGALSMPPCPTGLICQRTVTICDTCFLGAVASNLFYGYVGRICGFYEATLLGGAHVIAYLRWWKPDPPSEQEAIKTGFCIVKRVGLGPVSREDLCACLNLSAGKVDQVPECIPCNAQWKGGKPFSSNPFRLF